MNVSFKTHKHLNNSTLYILPSCTLWCGWMLNNSDAWPEISFKLFLDLQDKTHFSVSNAWISANGKMCHAVSYSNTFTGLVKLAPVSVGWHWTQLPWTARGGGGVVVSYWDHDWLIDQTKAQCKYSSYLWATTGNEAALLCVNSRRANFVAGHILQSHLHYASMNRRRNPQRGLTVSRVGI